MDKSIPYEIIVVFSIQRAVFVTEGFGTHKCVPYENDRALSYISYLNPINAPFPAETPSPNFNKIIADNPP